jgi:hypothetical protein
MPTDPAPVAAAMLMPLLVAACMQYQTPNGTTMLGTAPPLSWSWPAGSQAAGPAPVPTDFGAAATEPAPAADLTGRYSGTAVVTYNPRLRTDCHDYTVNAFQVSGREARFFGFRGTISPQGQVVMQSGDQWLDGRFVGRQFFGQLWRRHPACAWNLSLTAG